MHQLVDSAPEQQPYNPILVHVITVEDGVIEF
jgi:hypothetical protein